MNFECKFLRERITSFRGRYIYNNLDVIPALKHFVPDLVVASGFNPTYLYSSAYAIVKKAAHVAMTDGTLNSEKPFCLPPDSGSFCVREVRGFRVGKPWWEKTILRL